MVNKHERVAYKQDTGTSTQKQFATCLAGNQNKSSVSELVMVLLSEPRLALQEQPGAGGEGGAESLAFSVGSVLSSPNSSGISGCRSSHPAPLKSHRLHLPWPEAKDEADPGLGRAKSQRGAGDQDCPSGNSSSSSWSGLRGLKQETKTAVREKPTWAKITVTKPL